MTRGKKVKAQRKTALATGGEIPFQESLMNEYVVALLNQGWSNLRIERTFPGYVAHATLAQTNSPGETMNAHMGGDSPAQAVYGIGRQLGRHFSPNPSGDDPSKLHAVVRDLQRQVGTALAMIAIYERFMQELERDGNESVKQVIAALREVIAELQGARSSAIDTDTTPIRPLTDRNHPKLLSQ